MRLWAVAHVFRKEMLETLRDRRTLFTTVVLPVLLYPAVMAGTVSLARGQVEKLAAEELAVAVGAGVPADLRDELAAARLRGQPGLPQGEVRDALARRRVVAALDAPADCAQALQRDGACVFILHFDETNDRSLAAVRRVQDTVRAWQESLLDSRARARGLPAGFVRPAQIEERSVSTAAERVGNLAGRILPILLISLMLAGAMYPALDMSAGEKERGTMQTMLCAPISPLEIVSGKYLAASLVALATAAVNLGSMILAGALMVRGMGAGATLLPAVAAVGGLAAALVFVLLAPLAMTFSALALAVGCFAKSYREAQSSMAPMYLLAVLPLMIVSLPGVELSGWLVWVPIVDLALLLREILVGRGGALVLPVLAVNAALAAGAVWFAARVFATEEALIGSGKSALLAVLRFRR